MRMYLTDRIKHTLCEYKWTLLDLTNSITLHARPFRVTAGSAAIAIIPFCRVLDYTRLSSRHYS